jgi:hypothetical protein
MRFGLTLPSFSFARDYATVARLRDFATGAEAMASRACGLPSIC